jgi:hypothetical protein
VKDNKSFKHFFFSCLILAIVCLGIAVGVHFFFLPQKSFESVYILVPYVMSVTMVFHWILMKASVANPGNFIGKFVAFSGIKLMIYLITILISAFGIKVEVLVFVTSFFTLYLFYTIIEIRAMLKFLKK